jgi:hypothetical protein
MGAWEMERLVAAVADNAAVTIGRDVFLAGMAWG